MSLIAYDIPEDEPRIEPQPGMQTLVLECPIRDMLVGGSRGPGKTTAMILKWLQHAGRWGKHAHGIVVRRSYPDLEDFIKKTKWILPQVGWIYREGKRTWINEDTGASLKLRFLENDEDAEKYQGHEYSFVGVDEAGQFQYPDPIDKMRATLRSAHGVKTLLMLTANPGGKGTRWLRERYIDPHPEGLIPHPDPRTGQMKIYIPGLLIHDNPLLLENDPEYVNQLKGCGPEWLVRAWLNGDWTVSPDGNAWKREHFKYYRHLPPLQFILQSWDTGFKTHVRNDRSACTTWGVAGQNWYLLHAWASRVAFPALKRMARELAATWHPHLIIVEDAASGQSLVQELKESTPDQPRLPVRAVQVDGDKLARAYAAVPSFECGRVLLPEDPEPWLHDFTEELCSFPNGAHDDQVDSTSMAIDYLRRYQHAMESQQRKVIPFIGSIYER